MKTLFLAFGMSIALSSSCIAEQITIDGLKSQYKTQTTAEVSHTEYRQEQRQSTCSRQVAVGSHQVCRQVGGEQQCYSVGGGEQCQYVGGGEECEDVGGGQECREVGGGQECGITPTGYQCFDLPSHQECYQVPGQRQCHQTPAHQECYQLPSHQECSTTPSHEECSMETDYKTEYYSCTETVNVPYTVKDSEIENNIVVNVEPNRNLPSGLKEVINLVQTPKELTLKSLKSTGKVLIYSTQNSKVISDNGRLKKLDTTIAIKLIDLKLALGAFLSPLGEISASNKGLQIAMGLVADPATVRFDLKITRNKVFAKDEVVIDRTLALSEINLVNSNNQTLANVDFAKLGIQDKIADKKVTITVKVQPNVDIKNVLNTADIPAGLGGTKELQTRLK